MFAAWRNDFMMQSSLFAATNVLLLLICDDRFPVCSENKNVLSAYRLKCKADQLVNSEWLPAHA